MKKYLVSFYWENEVNNELSVSLRTKIENLSPDKWIHIFPNLLVIQSNLSIDEIYSELLPEADKTRIVIVDFDKNMTNESRSNEMLKDYGY